MGFRLVRVQVCERAARRLQIMAERPGRHLHHRRLRGGEPRDLAAARCRGPGPRPLSSRGFLARHRPAAGAPRRISSAGPAMRPRSRWRCRRPAASAFAASSKAMPTARFASSSTIREGGEPRGCWSACLSPISREAKLVLTDALDRSGPPRQPAATAMADGSDWTGRRRNPIRTDGDRTWLKRQ